MVCELFFTGKVPEYMCSERFVAVVFVVVVMVTPRFKVSVALIVILLMWR